MLPRQHRLPLRFLRHLTENSAVQHSTPLFTALINPKPGTQPIRFAFLISKKISPSAVIRNKLRRQLVGALLPLLKHLNPSHDIIIYAKKALLNSTSATLNSTLKNFLSQAKIYNSQT